MDWVLGKVVNQSDCRASFGNTKITDLVFANYAVFFAESLQVLVMALEALHEEAKPFGLEVSWFKTKVQVFGGLLYETVQSVHTCSEDIEILESFTYLGSAVHNDGGSRQEVLRRIGIAHGVMDLLNMSIWRCRYLCRRTKIQIFKLLVIPVLLYGCETWTLNSDLKRRIDAFELGDCKSGQEITPDVELDPFHFHSTCKTETIASVSSSFKVVTDFVTNAEEELLMKEVEPHLKRLKYEFDHWDDAIHGFREVERSRWSTRASSILDRARQAAFPDPCQKLPQTHVLDLDKAGVIKPHVDSVRFCGNIICGLCLLSDAVMRLRHVDLKDQVVDVLLRRGSFYIMRQVEDETRYNFTHEVLGEEESFFRGVTVVRGRRVSIMSRNQPSKPSPDAGPFIA
ncbi:Alpha-ketoglutarate-dependent dioxygenase alkB 7, mitochondrial [Chionoecetes opilio]|uniref:Alpha-ketoglutarate-dependent dioxygenase alkB 7, mitochondrial n=1 Tax=Chionoecetes opilio TaxID=41210 RepID=A0A8J4YLE9_CHIOP|nr:Alpha-ketoglutarate-dependent dioxygenase alkB 7, mitochondrial [Chionoecetes opilio]